MANRNISTKTTAERLAGLLNTYYAKKTDLADSIKAASYSNNTLKLFRSTDTTGEAAFSFDLPEEMFLDQTKTVFVGNFAWSDASYPGSTNPNLDGKPVMVLAVKGDSSTTYSFLDMETLVDTYSGAAGDGSATVTVSGYTIAVNVNVSSKAGNLLAKENDGTLYVDGSGKADKVASATAGHLAGLDANGNLTDSGVAADDVQQKLSSFTSGNVRTSDANGFAQDSGVALADVVVSSDIADYTEAELRQLLGLPASD